MISHPHHFPPSTEDLSMERKNLIKRIIAILESTGAKLDGYAWELAEDAYEGAMVAYLEKERTELDKEEYVAGYVMCKLYEKYVGEYNDEAEKEMFTKFKALSDRYGFEMED